MKIKCLTFITRPQTKFQIDAMRDFQIIKSKFSVRSPFFLAHFLVRFGVVEWLQQILVG